MRGVLFSIALVLASGVWVCVSGLVKWTPIIGPRASDS